MAAAAAVAAPAMAADPFIMLGGPMNGGNLSIYPEGQQFKHDVDFGIFWFGEDLPPADQRFTDLSGMVGSVDAPGDLWPFLFDKVELTSKDGSTVFGSHSLAQAVPSIEFSFKHVLAGKDYRLSFYGKAADRPQDPGFMWPVREWQYNVGAVVSQAPEPSEWAMLAVGVAVVGLWTKRRRQGGQAAA